MTKVEINGKTYCVETLIYTVERLTKDVKASAEHHRLVLDKIWDEIEQHNRKPSHYPVDMISIETVLQIIDKYR